ncbi:MAG TPA: hypothetical protein VMV54_02400 [Acidocella sp.]|nr:hypothetical protein [Acidocella sp.]
MQVFIANGTMHNKVFMYRVVEGQQIRQITIPSKRQVKFPEDFSGPGLEYLIKQLERAGGVPQNDLNSITSAYAMVYSVSKDPIVSDKIDQSVNLDKTVRQAIAGDMTEAAGLVSFATLAGPNPDALKATGLEVVQLGDQGDDTVRDGVSFEANVSREAGGRRDGKRRAA